MPRRRLLTPTERASLLALPATEDEFIQHYTLTEPDLSLIGRRYGVHNRLGFAVQLCYLRYPGLALPTDEEPPLALLDFVARQLRVDASVWEQYTKRPSTRREHLAQLQAWLNLTPFGLTAYRGLVRLLSELAQQTDRGIVLASALIEAVRQQRLLMPGVEVIERICAEALTRGTRQVYRALTASLSKTHRQALDNLLEVREGSNLSGLAWLRQPAGAPNAKHVLSHLERLQFIHQMNLPDGLEREVHQNRLLKLAREGGQMTAQHLRDFEDQRRYATLVALVLETGATLTDEIIDLNDRILGALFSRAKRRHGEAFQQSGKAVHEKVQLYSRIGRALCHAKQSGDDPYAAIEAVLPWDVFLQSITEAEALTQSVDQDFLPLICEGFTQLRRYTPTLLATLPLTAAPSARDLLAGVETLQDMNRSQARKVPEGAPTSFVRRRWARLVQTDQGLDRRFYELCVLSELKNALRSGDLWVRGSRQFKDFDSYLLPLPRFTAQRDDHALGLAVDTNCEGFLSTRCALLEHQFAHVERLAAHDELPDASLTPSGLKVTPLTSAVPQDAEALIRQVAGMMPHLKITELLLEVDGWTDFTRHFTHLKSHELAGDKSLLLTTILADGINLGLAKMAESCPGTTYAKLSWLQAWHVRDETYAAALAELVHAQSQHPFARAWGEGATSSSDGQWFRAGGLGQAAGHWNAKYGNEPGVTFYTHLSDQFAPFHTKVINAAVRDATYVLDGLLYHESDLRIEEHYTDTAGFTDHVFGLMPLLGFRFAPRIRDLKDKNLYVPGDAKIYPTLEPLIGGKLNTKPIYAHWDEILRLATSIKQGTGTASLLLRKLGSYPRQNGLALALRELGRIERTLFTLDWLQSVELRRRVQIGLNKGEAKNALARAVFFNRRGELRERTFENQHYRASGLNLIVAAIVLWNTVYLERAISALKERGQQVDDQLLQHLSPLAWEHINLTGDYLWPQSKQPQKGRYRPLRTSITS